MGAVVMLLGTGHLGGPLLDRLAASPWIDRVVAVGRDRERGTRRCNLASLSALCGGRAARVSFLRADLERSGELAAGLSEVAPDLVVHAASLQTWWLGDLLPSAERMRLRAVGYAPWLPLHLPLALQLMREVEDAGYPGAVFNAAYPDVVNVILSRVGRAATGGLGNIDELVAKVRRGASAALGGAVDLEIRLVAHHALQRFAFEGAAPARPGERRGGDDIPPFHLRVTCRGEDVTESVAADQLLLAPCPLPAGPAWGIFSASAAVAFIEAWLADRPSLQHCAGPGSLPGGYPVEVGGGAMTRVAVDGLTPREAVEINERAQRFDGVEAIGDDGTIEITAGAAEAMRELLGFDCRRLRPADATAAAAELTERFRRYAAGHGVDVSVVGKY